MHDPYVGITGYNAEIQVEKLLSLIPENFSRKFMIGVLVDDRTLGGEKRDGRFARIENIQNIFDTSKSCDEHGKALNFVHYCDINNRYKKHLLSSLVKITEISGENLHGFQLNMPWPDTDVISKYRSIFPDKKFVVQMERDDFDTHGPERMAKELTQYNGLCEYVILDMSMGAGREMNRVILAKYAKQVRKTTDMNIVFAGGLHSGNLDEMIKPLLKKFPDMSIDAEGRLMTSKNVLDIHDCSAYILKALEIF
jgi:hypothetical protein